MATIAEQLTSLANTKTAIKDAIVAKGVTVAGTDPFSAYPAKIGQIQAGGGAPATKYGVSIDNMLGNVDANGWLQSAEQFDFVGTGIKIIGMLSDFNNTFAYNNCIKSASFPDLEEIDGIQEALGGTFQYSLIETLDMGNVVTITGTNSCNLMCQYCTKLHTVIFTKLTTIDGFLCFNGAFRGCTALTAMYFPSLTTITNVNVMGTGSASYTFRNCTALTEIHFRADAQAVIESLTAYSNKFGATNCTIYFDL